MSARDALSESPPEDTDSPMQNSESDDIIPSSIAQITPSTPTHLQQPALADLSPPDSHGLPRRTTALGAVGAMAASEILNANGKRTFDATAHAAGNPGAAPAQKGQFSHPSGYSWDKDEDAPGYAWMNKKAQEEQYRAMSQILDVDLHIKNRYGDVLLDEAAR